MDYERKEPTTLEDWKDELFRLQRNRLILDNADRNWHKEDDEREYIDVLIRRARQKIDQLGGSQK